MEPLFVSKINTVFQLGLICVVLAGLAGLSVPGLDKPMTWAEAALVWLVAITTVISGVAYGNAALRIFKARRPAE
jgi:phosphatidylglycerophosphate synthase